MNSWIVRSCTLQEAKVLIERWRKEYNTIRSHSSPGYRPPEPEAVRRFGLPTIVALAPLIFLRTGGEAENLLKMAFLQWGIALLALFRLAGARGDVAVRRAVTPLDASVCLFYLLCLTSLLGAVNPSAAIPLLLHWGAGVILYFLLTTGESDERALRRLCLASVLGVLIVCVIGILQVRFGLRWIPQAVVPGSTFGNPNMASHFVAIVCPLVLGGLVLSRRWRYRLPVAAALLFSVVYLGYTGTRSAWLAVAVVVSGMLLAVPGASDRPKGIGRRGVLRAAGALLILAAVAASLGYFLGETWIPRTEAGPKTAVLRLVFWKNTLAMARDHPGLGVGLANFKLQYPLYHRAAEVDWTFRDEYQLQRVHNDHLQILAELGLPGFLAWVSVFAAAGLLVLWIFRRGTTSLRLRATIVFLGLLSFATVAFFSFPLERALTSVLLFAYLGLISSLYRECVGRATLPVRPIHVTLVRWMLAAVIVSYLAASIHSTGRAVAAEGHYVKARELADAGRFKASELAVGRAISLAPRDPRFHLLQAANHAAREDYEKAIREARETLRWHPNQINAISNLGYYHLRLGRHDEAKQHLERALALSPDSPRVHNNLGVLYHTVGANGRAIEHLQQAVTLARSRRVYGASGPFEFIEPHLHLAAVYLAQEKPLDAIAEYETVLELRPGREDVRRLLDALHRQTGQPERSSDLLGSDS